MHILLSLQLGSILQEWHIIISGSQVMVIIAGAAYMFKVGNSSLYSSLFKLRFVHCWFYM